MKDKFKVSYNRISIYIILSGLIVAGAGLSYVIFKATAGVRSTSVPALREKAEIIQHISELERALLRYELTLNTHSTKSLGREKQVELDRTLQQDMRTHIEYIERHLDATDNVRDLIIRLQEFTDFIGLVAVSASASFNMETETKLLGIGIRSNVILDLLQQFKTSKQMMLDASENSATNQLDRISRLVYIYSFGIIVTGIFMFHHLRTRFRLEDEMAHYATHDPLTGLPNRRAFELALRKLNPNVHTVILASVDRFERIVNELGHRKADKLIKLLSTRLKDAVKKRGGQLFRIDGANIAMLYECSGNHTALQTEILELRSILRRPFNIDRQEIILHLSLGTADYPNDGADPARLVRNAGTALEAARDLGGDSFVSYNETLSVRHRERIGLETALSHALEFQELELHYQPQKRLQDGKLTGFEALLRWRHRGRTISPANFIPLAEESGQIVEIGAWVLEQACQQARIWRNDYQRPVTIAVNVSARQFRHPGFLQRVANILARSWVNPGDIELEITEGMVIEKTDRVIALLENLRGLGLKLAIDDFGTGYSNLSYLTRFPVSRLKIDRSFIRDMGGGPRHICVVQAAISLGHNLGLSVLAEGVETQEQLECLSRLSCDEIQGYLYGHPLPKDEATAFLLEHP